MKWNLNQIISGIELELIQMAFEETKNKAHAAKLLGLNRTTLLMKMKKYGMTLLPPNCSITKEKAKRK